MTWVVWILITQNIGEKLKTRNVSPLLVISC